MAKIPPSNQVLYFLPELYVLDQKDMHKFMTLLPKDYCLIPGNRAIKLVGSDQSIYTSYNTITQKIII